ncbi:hypothetical protein WH52_06940 [Tenacibaculum holothuriorum]|uniref:POTRA domain-containing protein n=1 Tax=Tenacibaculum holothuriorum TaxID=1635173 RepID=A0A1Y2PDC5_9FLAO|nr:POTRA domain-containing protein [Tenacibaculum holothuriorum]OSY88484.1 hypothetical protein WH52_06940 [Tenacibaculum holothuriorum]
MNKVFIPYIYIVLFSLSSIQSFSQVYSLKILSKDSIENSFLKKVNFKTTHSTKEKTISETKVISNKLKRIGFFLNSIDSIKRKDSLYTSYYSLGKKIDSAFIFNTKDKSTHSISIEKLPDFLSSISNKLDSKGKSFSKTQLKNIRINNNKLFADIFSNESKERIINKIVIKGYDNFSKSHIKHFLKIKKNTILSKDKLTQISSSIRNLDFVSEIKPPEVLFTKDSTFLYLYLKKTKNNSFDGLVNFSSNQNGNGLSFNGHLDLKLNNILNTGEKFELTWNANGNERQDFNLKTEIPYIFNSPITPSLHFNIYKQDSTFLNTELNTSLKYNINQRFSTSLVYNSINSTNSLQTTTNNLVKAYSSFFTGIEAVYKTKSLDFKNQNKFFVRLQPLIGKRTLNNTNTNQFKIESEINYLLKLNPRSFIYLRNHTGYLESNNYLQNELFRIGGINSIRGYLPQSVFIDKFSYFNIEYRFKTSNNNYLYSITDFDLIKTNNQLLTIGAGYNFSLNSSLININLTFNYTSNNLSHPTLTLIFKNTF